MADIGPGDDQGIQALLADFSEGFVVAGDVVPGRGAPRQGVQAEGMDEKLGDGIALPDQAEELALGRRQRRVRHHVAQPDVQFANVLVQGARRIEDVLPFLAQALESRKIVVRDNRHGGDPMTEAQGVRVHSRRAMACSIRWRKSRSSRTWATSVERTV